MASDPLIAAVEAARERGVTRAALLTEEATGEIALRTVGEWNGLEMRGLGVMLNEITAASETDDDEDD
jgi:hypothetical protein